MCGLDGQDVYFAHSYSVHPTDELAGAVVDHDGPVVAAVEQGALAGVQFHPERSACTGAPPAKERDRVVKKRLIPCLDVTQGRVVKGLCFEQLRNIGDPVSMARRYSEQGADELVFLDITASLFGHDPTAQAG